MLYYARTTEHAYYAKHFHLGAGEWRLQNGCLRKNNYKTLPVERVGQMPTKNSHIVSRLLISYRIWDKGSKCIHFDALPHLQLRRHSENSFSENERSCRTCRVAAVCNLQTKQRTLRHYRDRKNHNSSCSIIRCTETIVRAINNVISKKSTWCETCPFRKDSFHARSRKYRYVNKQTSTSPFQQVL